MRVLLIALILASLPTLPKDDGWQTLKRGDEPIEIFRDKWGIPHIFAPSIEGAFWAEGWLEAEDRLWQMETFRRAGKGESAELLGGDRSLTSDRERRRNGYTEDELQKMLGASTERMRSIVHAYSDGVNAFMATGKRPPQYAAHKHEPRPWTGTDSLAIGIMMARTFGEAGDVELQVQTVYGALERKYGSERATVILRDILRDSDPQAPTTLNDHERASTPPKSGKGSFAPRPVEHLAAILRERAEVIEAREALGIPWYGGSNAWVIGPGKSASGRPILYGGPMMGFRAPSICNEIHLNAPGLNVAGMSFPGVPGVMIGFNDRIAFTTTSGGADLVDIFELQLKPDDPDQYRHGDQWLRFESFEAEIRIAGSEPIKERILRSRYGPLVGERRDGRAYSKRMSFWMQEHLSFEAVLDFGFATSVDEFAKAVRKVTTSHNWFAADRDGHIGFWYAGAHPKRRKGHDPRLPVKGDGSMDWEGILRFEQWPQAINPAHGFFANWNNKPSRTWEPSAYGRLFWGKRIIDTIERTPKLTFEQCEALAREAAYHDFLADYFAPHMIAAAAGEKEGPVAEAAALLVSYDRAKRPGRPEPVLVERWVKRMMQRVFGDEFGIAIADRTLQRFLADPLLYLLEGRDVLKYDFAGGVDLKAEGLESLRAILKDGLDALAWKDETIDFRGRTAKIESADGRGTFQMTVELRPDGPHATTLAAPGQQEAEAAPHSLDQVDLFRVWKYKPFTFRREAMK